MNVTTSIITAKLKLFAAAVAATLEAPVLAIHSSSSWLLDC